MTTTKYAVDIIAPTVIIDRHSGERVIIEWIEPVEGQDKLIFDGFFEDSHDEYHRTLDWDSQVRVLDHDESF